MVCEIFIKSGFPLNAYEISYEERTVRFKAMLFVCETGGEGRMPQLVLHNNCYSVSFFFIGHWCARREPGVYTAAAVSFILSYT